MLVKRTTLINIIWAQGTCSLLLRHELNLWLYIYKSRSLLIHRWKENTTLIDFWKLTPSCGTMNKNSYFQFLYSNMALQLKSDLHFEFNRLITYGNLFVQYKVEVKPIIFRKGILSFPNLSIKSNRHICFQIWNADDALKDEIIFRVYCIPYSKSRDNVVRRVISSHYNL